MPRQRNFKPSPKPRPHPAITWVCTECGHFQHFRYVFAVKVYRNYRCPTHGRSYMIIANADELELPDEQ